MSGAPHRGGLAPAGIDIPNFRDVGGWPTGDGGVVRTGLLFRSVDLGRVRGDLAGQLGRLGIRTVYDLRTVPERERWPEVEQLPAGVDYVVADVLRDAPEGTPAHIMPLLSEPERVREVLGEGRGERMFLRKYRDFINLASARQAIHLLLSDLAVPNRTPAVVHCTTGKDRTGWALAVLQLLLGVSEADVMADYLASNAALDAWTRAALAEFEASGGEAAVIGPMVTVQPAYLQTALDEMRRGFGTVRGYLEAGLAIGPLTQRRLRTLFVGRA